MNRRTFLSAATGGFLAAPLAAAAQQVDKVARVGFLDDVSPRNVPWLAAFERRLRELGHVEGRNLLVEFRSAGGRVDRLADLAVELVRLKPDVIAHLGGPDGARALRQATSTIPIVLAAIEWDPVTAGVVASIARPPEPSMTAQVS